MGDQSEKIVASMTDLEDQLGNVGSRLVQGWSIGRSLATSLMRNSEHNRKLGTIFIAVGDSIQDAIREQRNLATIMLRTGRESSLLNAELIGTMNMHGLSFKEAADVLQTTFVGGLNKSDKTTLKLMGQLQLLGVDVRKSVTMTAMNRHVLGMSVRESENLVKSMVETASQYHISTNAVVDAVNGLRETLKSTTITYGPAVSKAIEQAMPRLLGIFGQEAGGEISTVVAALLGGGPKQAELAAKLGIPLEDLSGARTSGKVVDLVMRAVSQLEGIVSPMRGIAGSEFSINAMIKAFGDVPELVLLGRRLSNMTALQKQENQERQFADMASKAQRDVLVSLFNDVKRGLTSVLIPMLGGLALILGGLNQIVESVSSLFNSSLNLGDILGRIMGAMTASWAFKNLGPMLVNMLAVMRGQAVGTAANVTSKAAATGGLLIGSKMGGARSAATAATKTAAKTLGMKVSPIASSGPAKSSIVNVSKPFVKSAATGKALGKSATSAAGKTVMKKGLMSGLGARLLGRSILGMSPLGWGLLLVSLFPFHKFFGKQDDMIEEQRKQTEIMQGDQNRRESRMVSKVSEAVAMLTLLNENQLNSMEEYTPLFRSISDSTGGVLSLQERNVDNFSLAPTPANIGAGTSYVEGGGGVK